MNATRDSSNFAPGLADPMVIAEIGVNHDGDPERALQLVDHAAGCGADAIKVQWFRASSLLSTEAALVEYQRASGEQDPASMLERLELGPSSMQEVLERARHHGLLAIATVFSPDLVGEAAALDWDMYKTASPDLVNRPLLEALAGLDRPMILSTGGATLDEVEQALGWVGDSRVALLHCVSSYPTPPEHAALGGIRALARAFDRPVGYSDHTLGWETGGLAVAAGATILEKHLTWNRSAIGPDHASSLDPELFGRYVESARRAVGMMGANTKQVLPIERAVREQARQSIAAGRDLAAGTELHAEDLTTMRPGNGIRPAAMPDLLGCRLVRDVKRGTLLQPGDLASVEVCP
ncbi:MAG: N-acetylneuraminate synthase family protein [Phycisphaerales bacterium]|nr:N-acetylneuraminate synthase family protein [Phycisphaerales bacterium]